jgi:hypothetical protein
MGGRGYPPPPHINVDKRNQTAQTNSQPFYRLNIIVSGLWGSHSKRSVNLEGHSCMMEEKLRIQNAIIFCSNRCVDTCCITVASITQLIHPCYMLHHCVGACCITFVWCPLSLSVSPSLSGYACPYLATSLSGWVPISCPLLSLIGGAQNPECDYLLLKSVCGYMLHNCCKLHTAHSSLLHVASLCGCMLHHVCLVSSLAIPLSLTFGVCMPISCY